MIDFSLDKIIIIDIILIISLIFFLNFNAKILRLIDFPNQRKIHKIPTPVIGGIAIFIATYVSTYFLNLPYLLNLILNCSLIVVFVGIIDDVFSLGITSRILTHIFASLIIISAGLQVENLGSIFSYNDFNLGIFSIFFTILAVAGLINAINFIDGIDGLSSGFFIIALFSIILFSNNYLFSQFTIIYILLINSFIFLFFNFGFITKIKIFLGDAGSTFLGFILAWLLIYYSSKEVGTLDAVATIWCVTIPVFDFFRIFLYRIINLKSPFHPDRNHIHHILLRANYLPIKVFFLLIILSIISSIIGYFSLIFFGQFYSIVVYVSLFIVYSILVNSIQNKNQSI